MCHLYKTSGCGVPRVVTCQQRCVDSLPLIEYSLDLVLLIVLWPVNINHLSVACLMQSRYIYLRPVTVWFYT